jgi:PhnB protein
MPKGSPAEQVDRAITALLASPQALPDAARGNSGAVVAQLLPLARDLRAMPRPEFKARLRSELQRRTFMMPTAAARSSTPGETRKFRRRNFPNIAPYFLVEDAPKFIDFLVAAFEGTERIRVPRPDGSVMHAEVAIGDSVIEMGDANAQYPSRPMNVHLFVPDADAAYARALELGATSVYAVAEQPYGVREGGVRDPFGNTWYLGTPIRWDRQALGFAAVQPFLHLRDADKMLSFAVKALGAQSEGVVRSPEGAIHHATLRIAGATLELAEAHGEHRPAPHYLHVYVPDADAAYERAVAAGAAGKTPPYTAPYGERSATIEDPFGNTWFLATYLGKDAV